MKSKSAPAEQDRSAPSFTLSDLKSIRSPAEKTQPLSKAEKTFSVLTEAEHVAWYAHTLAKTNARFIPMLYSPEELVALIKDKAAGAGALVADRTWSEIQRHIERITYARKLSQLKPISISKYPRDVSSDFDRVQIDSGAVTVLKAPMGSGKTRAVGIPFVKNCKENGGIAIALCHLSSLSIDLANTLDLCSYTFAQGKEAPDMIKGAGGLATCINSLPHDRFNASRADVTGVFIDEASQVMRAILARSGTMKGQQPIVLEALREILRKADRILIADADMNDLTIQFFAWLADKPVKVFDVQPPQSERRVSYDFDKQAALTVYSELLARLRAGERCIVATDSSKQVELIRELVESKLPRVKGLYINRELKGGKTGLDSPEQQFLAHADTEARKYQLIVHSPTISSGLSIVEDGSAPMDHGFGIFCGVVAPSDSIQMLYRARKLQRWTVAIIDRPQKLALSAGAILEAARSAATYAGEAPAITDTDHWIAIREANEDKAVSDYAAGIVWQLEHIGFNVERVEYQACIPGTREARENVLQARIQAVIEASDISEAARLIIDQKEAPTIDEVQQAKRYDIRNQLGIDEAVPVAEGDVEYWDEGAGSIKAKKYLAIMGKAECTDESEKELMSRKFQQAKHEAYKELLSCIATDPTDPTTIRFTETEANKLVDKITEQPLVYLGLGIIGRSGFRITPNGVEFKRHGKATRYVNELLTSAGIITNLRQHEKTGANKKRIKTKFYETTDQNTGEFKKDETAATARYAAQLIEAIAKRKTKVEKAKSKPQAVVEKAPEVMRLPLDQREVALIIDQDSTGYLLQLRNGYRQKVTDLTHVAIYKRIESSDSNRWEVTQDEDSVLVLDDGSIQ